MIMTIRHFCFAAMLCASSVTPALALTLRCAISPGAGGTPITDDYAFDYDESSGKAQAADGVIMHYFDAPITAKVTDDSAKKLVFAWDIKMTNNSGQQTKMMYRATYFKETGKMTVRATPGGGYSNSFEGRGSCQKV
jgi:hypothetical protein